MKKLILILLIIIISFSSIAAINPIKYCELESNFPICSDNNIYNGYWWNNFWIPGIPTQESQMLINPPVVSGRAVFYGPQVMEGTARFRGLKITDKYLDGVSLLTCGDIGKSVWLKRPGHDWEGPFLVVDCAKRGDLYGIINYRKEAVEVGFKTAQRWGMAHYVDNVKWKYKVDNWKIDNVLVSKYPPRIANKLDSVNMKSWFNSNVDFSTKSIDKDTCKLQYQSPTTDGALPTWRVDCRWTKLPNIRITEKDLE